MPETISCPYCQKVNELKHAKAGQHLPYMRCVSCNLLIWFYGGVPNMKPKSVVPETKKEKGFDFFPFFSGGGE